MPHARRSNARMLALQALCVFDSVDQPDTADLDRFLQDPVNHADLGWGEPPRAETISFARALAVGALQIRSQCDALLLRCSNDWSIERMQPVDRNILRLGLYELLQYPDTPHSVVINEAVELARRFGSAESPAFVNGVLDALKRELAATDTSAQEAAAVERPTEAASPNHEG